MAQGTRTAGRRSGGARGPGRGRKRKAAYVVRLGVSLDPDLLTLLDGWVRERNSPSRSDAIRALI